MCECQDSVAKPLQNQPPKYVALSLAICEGMPIGMECTAKLLYTNLLPLSIVANFNNIKFTFFSVAAVRNCKSF